MVTETVAHGTPTRRDAITSGGAVIGGGLPAGCAGEDRSGTTTGAATETTTPADDADSVTMAPTDEVEIEGIPRNVFTDFPWYADMAVALGYGDSINSLSWGQGLGLDQELLADSHGISSRLLKRIYTRRGPPRNFIRRRPVTGRDTKTDGPIPTSPRTNGCSTGNGWENSVTETSEP